MQKILRDKGARHVAELGRAAEPVPVLRVVEPRSNVIALERLAEAMREPVRIDDAVILEDSLAVEEMVPAEDAAPAEGDAAPETVDEPLLASEATAPGGAVAVEQPAAASLAEADQIRLEILLAELLQMKARLAQRTRRTGRAESPRNAA